MKWLLNIFKRKIKTQPAQTQQPDPKPTNVPVFVYGTLRTGQGNYNWSFKNHVTRKTIAHAQGFVLEFAYPAGGYPVMRPADKDSVVTGELMWLSNTMDAQHILDSVDAMERGAGYTKKLINIFYWDEEDYRVTTQAWAYVMERGEHKPEMRIASGDWLRRFEK